MSLTYDLTKTADMAALQTDEEWPITKGCTFLTISIGIGQWTEANIAEVYARVQLVETLHGSMVQTIVDGRPVDRPMTPEDIRRRIGLRTNVAPESRAKFLKRHVTAQLDDSVRRYTRVERDRLAAAI